jgi:hypothetical protein
MFRKRPVVLVVAAIAEVNHPTLVTEREASERALGWSVHQAAARTRE